ncbi:hypothetical protein BC941DRAFT_71703 [Chlamydoabsidia padenii]|nr:hypothetical protein BC941DRAFT_71703 [Chlamydoabsidia padenii]
MDQLSSRKRPADSEQEEDEGNINKKPLLDYSLELDHSIANNTNGNDQHDIMTMNDETNLGQEAPTTSSAADYTTEGTVIPYQRLVLINLEVTCDENPTNPAAVQVTKENAEIIQLSFAIVNASNMELLKHQVIHVKPERTPLTQFCTQITGITSDTLASAGTLKEAIELLDKTIQSDILDNQLDFCLVTHGGWVLRIQLPREARDKKLDLPNYLSHPRLFDLKQEIQRWQAHHSETHLRTTSLKELCHVFEVPMVRKKDSMDSSTGDDTLQKVDDGDVDILATTVNVIRHLTKFKYNDVFVYPIDTLADLQQFNAEDSLVVHLAGLPYEVTQGELEAWFASNGLRPSRMWMMQTSEQTKPSLSGFVVFTQHEDALNALLLNGRSFNDRVIAVSPNSERVVEAAASILSPFPLQAKARQVRPGDWNCPNCSFHNFASRRHCFKCNAENSAGHTSSLMATPTGPAGGNDTSSGTLNNTGTPLSNSGLPSSSSTSSHSYTSNQTPGSATPFTSGDWICTSTTCGFHNYSSRAQCLKCGSYRPGAPGSVALAPSTSSSSSQGTGYNNSSTNNSNNNSNIINVNTNTSSNHNNNSPHNTSNPYHAPRPASFRPGDWFCSCGFQNFASRMSCFRCQAPNPAPAQPASVGSSSLLGGYGYDSGTNGSAFASSYGTLPVGNAIVPGTGGHGFRAGDWYCPSCNSHNFASRFQCLKCHTAKPYTQTQSNPSTVYGTTSGYRGPPPMKSKYGTRGDKSER